ncbi:hypothetical protein SS50377_23382 [Spironucleus salmonicida]|uniref:Uncharacterized protein n=2 Tax=Spironucleus salmonicida TaxID=348837 RepID=A0A9P8LXI0_9EUKA|nr:hypothetical protein SS50377_23382 [Spironucleus salmonicida]
MQSPTAPQFFQAISQQPPPIQRIQQFQTQQLPQQFQQQQNTSNSQVLPIVQLQREHICQKILIFKQDIQLMRQYSTDVTKQQNLDLSSSIIQGVYKNQQYLMYRVFDHFFIAVLLRNEDDPQRALLIRYARQPQQLKLSQ